MSLSKSHQIFPKWFKWSRDLRRAVGIKLEHWLQLLAKTSVTSCSFIHPAVQNHDQWPDAKLQIRPEAWRGRWARGRAVGLLPLVGVHHQATGWSTGGTEELRLWRSELDWVKRPSERPAGARWRRSSRHVDSLFAQLYLVHVWVWVTLSLTVLCLLIHFFLHPSEEMKAACIIRAVPGSTTETQQWRGSILKPL